MFDGKGMTLKKPGCARVEMQWNQIHDRIRNLVRKDSYLSVEEAEERRARHSSEEELFDEVPNISEETQEPNDSEQSNLHIVIDIDIKGLGMIELLFISALFGSVLIETIFDWLYAILKGFVQS